MSQAWKLRTRLRAGIRLDPPASSEGLPRAEEGAWNECVWFYQREGRQKMDFRAEGPRTQCDIQSLVLRGGRQ